MDLKEKVSIHALISVRRSVVGMSEVGGRVGGKSKAVGSRFEVGSTAWVWVVVVRIVSVQTSVGLGQQGCGW